MTVGNFLSTDKSITEVVDFPNTTLVVPDSLLPLAVST